MKLNDKEREALLFVMDNTPMVIRGIGKEVGCGDVAESLEKLRASIEDRKLPVPLNLVDQRVLKFAIEDSDWIATYAAYAPTEEDVEVARQTLRNLAKRLEPLGVEVDRLANAA